MSRKGFEFDHTEKKGNEDIGAIEKEGEEIYTGLIGNMTAEVIVNDDKGVTVNDSKNLINDDAILNRKSNEYIDTKEITLNRKRENNNEVIVNKATVQEDNHFTVNDNRIITVMDNKKVIVNDNNRNLVLAGKLTPEKSEWIAYKNSLLRDLDELYKRDYEGMPFSKRYYQWWMPDEWAYVSICNSALYYFLHKLLYFDRSIEPVSVRELKEIHEDVYYEQKSYSYGLLPEEYPYSDFFKQLENSIAQWIDYCTDNENQKITFKLYPSLKLKIYCILRQMKPEPNQDYYVLNTYDNEIE